MTSSDTFLLQVLVDRGLVAANEARAAAEQANPNVFLGAVRSLLEKGIVGEDAFLVAVADAFQVEAIDLRQVSPSPEALALIPREFALQRRVLPLQVDGGLMAVALADPGDVDLVDSLAHLCGLAIDTRVASPLSLQDALERHYAGAGGAPSGSSSRSASGDSNPAGDFSFLEETLGEDAPSGASGAEEGEGPIIRYVQRLIAEAVRRRASDIHLEPLEKRFRIRFRIDGVMQEFENPPKRLQPSIISRLKIMANISIAEKRVPLDGRIAMKVGERALDLRVSSLPTAFGESIVMRILDKEGLRLGLPELGFLSDDQALFERLIGGADGIFLVTGPTGSGKSTTLYSALHSVNKPDRKIITVEDPVEYEMPGINQVQVREDVGMTFSAALRSMLRQAPNIIMVGEIRDKETAEIAVNASLTGHMVYSTLHTNDAPSAVSRLTNIGIPAFLVSASLRGVLAQRLVRQIDPDHNEPWTPPPSELSVLGVRPDQLQSARFLRGVPHPANGGTGFRGRKGIFEIFAIDDTLRQMIYEKASLVELRKKARELGMRSMREDGFRKVLAGMTTLDEVLTVTVETPES